MMFNVFIIWNWLVILGFVALIFREDSREMFSFKLLVKVFNGFWSAFFTLIILYFYIPLTLPYSIMKFLKRK